MATNSLGTLASALIIQRALEMVFTERPLLNDITLDLSGGFVNPNPKLNQQVISRIHTPSTVNNFGTGATNFVSTDVPVTLNQHKEVHHEFLVTEYNATERNLVEEAARPMAQGIADHLVDAVAALWTVGNFAGPTKETILSVANSDYDAIVAMRLALMKRGCPVGYRKFFAVNADVYAVLLADQRVIDASYNPANVDAISMGKISTKLGFDIYEYPALPTANTKTGFAGTKDSTVLVARVPADPRQVLNGAPFPGNIGYVSEPKTGFTVMVTEWIDPSTLKCNTRLNFMYGIAAGNTNNGQRLVTASTT